jgi:5-methylthioadenosine/S-adenosylhomocysteine deaminase
MNAVPGKAEGRRRSGGDFEGRLGRLEPGYLADVVFLDLDGFGFVPLNDPTNQLVLSEDGSAVHSVMVAGQFAYRNRSFLRFDEARLKAEVAKTLERLKQDTAEDRLLAERLEAHMRSTCLGLARSPYHVHRTCAWH